MPSSVIHGMVYSPAGRTLDVVFQGAGGAYRYYEVSAAEWRAFKRAPSKGTYLNAVFKARHPQVERIEGMQGRLQQRLFASVVAPVAAVDRPDENVWGFYEGSVLR